MASLYGNLVINKISGNLLINKQTLCFSSPEQLIELLISNNSLDEFLEMVEEVKKDIKLMEKKERDIREATQ